MMPATHSEPMNFAMLDGHLMVAMLRLLELRETLQTHEQQHITALLECELLSACAIVTARVVR